MDPLGEATGREQLDNQRSLCIYPAAHGIRTMSFCSQYGIEGPWIRLLNIWPGYVLFVAKEHYSCIECRSKPKGQSSPCPLCTSRLDLMIELVAFVNKSHASSYPIRTTDTEYTAGVDGPLDDLGQQKDGKKCSGWDPGYDQKIDDSSLLIESVTIDNDLPDNAHMSQTQLGKRKLAIDQNRDEDGDGGARKRRHSGAKKQFFACPFFKRDREQHSSCRNRKFKKISQLEGHIIRRHAFGDYYCAICYEDFPDAASWTIHCRSPSCQPRATPPRVFADDFCTLCQDIVLLRHTPTQMWFAIWDNIFPGIDRPESPYIS
uniref:C2H2-type domain-containing protein n=1 Tax=Bionectria ochroleuca TaxID=29856 RepID=A0A8H7K784_BIOOC